MAQAQSRKSLQEGNEACFRVEFEEAAGAQQQPGWGSTRYVKSVLIVLVVLVVQLEVVIQ